MDISAGRGGVQFAFPGDIAITVPNANALTFDAGVFEEASNIHFVPAATNSVMTFTATADSLLEADNNMIVTGYAGMTWGATQTITFTATKGDMLFRSTSTVTPFDLSLFGSTQVVIRAFERIEHRQVCCFFSARFLLSIIF